jgi:hypothetical protein
MRSVAGTIALAAAIGTAHAAVAQSPSDGDIKSGLVGSWIIPPDSSDFTPGMPPIVEAYTADGRVYLVRLKNGKCDASDAASSGAWSVENGVIVTKDEDGSISRDTVVSLSADGLILHSQDDGTTYKRARGPGCAGGAA